MKTLSLTLLMLGAASVAYADDVAEPRPYLSFQTGVALGVDYDSNNKVLKEIDTRRGPVFSLLAGFDYGDWRTDVELSHMRQSIKSINGLNQSFNAGGDVDSTSLLFNGYYAPKYDVWEPYVGAGLGYTRYDAKLRTLGVELSDKDGVFTWQGKAGVAYHWSENYAVDVNYAYQDGSDIKFDGIAFDQQQSIIRAGLRYTF